MLGKENRRSPRNSFKKPLDFEFNASRQMTGPLERKAMGIDISSVGVGLETDGKLQKGEVVKMSVPLSKEDATVPVFAEVRWVVRDGNNYRAGLQFLS